MEGGRKIERERERDFTELEYMEYIFYLQEKVLSKW